MESRNSGTPMQKENELEKNSLPAPEEKSESTPQPVRTFLAPLPGFTWNPLMKLPGNRTCPCQSGKKFKRCCLPMLPRAVPEKVAALYREQMKKPGLTFLTRENEEVMRKRAEAQGKRLPPDYVAKDATPDAVPQA